MTNLNLLRAELDAGHPDTMAYSADSQIASDQINLVNRTLNRTSMGGSEILEATVPSEYNALSDAQKSQFLGLLGVAAGRDGVDPFGKAADLIISIFGSGSATVTALAALRKPPASRAEELGFSNVRPGTIQQARAL